MYRINSLICTGFYREVSDPVEAAEAARKATRAAQRCSQRAARTAEQRAAERAANTAARSASRAAAADEHAATHQSLGDLTNRQVVGSPTKVNAQNKQLELHLSLQGGV